MTDLFGQAVAPASPTAPQASSVAARMSATYGLRSSTSSASAALQASLASRLPALLGLPGSIMFALIWKAQSTPLRRQICRLAASAHRIGDSGFTGWRSPTKGNGDRGGQHPDGREGHNLNLQDQVFLAGWPTPMAGTPAQNGNNAAGNNDSSRLTVALAAWPTPNCPSGGRSMSPDKMDATGRTLDGKKHTASLEHAVKFANWPTPLREYSESTGAHRGKPDTLHSATQLTHGQTSNGSIAATEKPGQLNPAFSLWLMGYPVVEWLSAAPSPTRRQKSPATSSAESAS